MSNANGNRTHGHCTCRVLCLTGMGFGTDIMQQANVSGNFIYPPPLSQAQIAQGRRDLQELTNTLPLQRGGRIWDDQPCWRTASREGPRPTQYGYALDIQIDTPGTPPQQTQANGPNSTNVTAATQTNVTESTTRNLGSNTPINQAVSASPNQTQATRRSRPSNPTSSAPRERGSTAFTTNRSSQTSRRIDQQRRTTSQLSRQSQSVGQNTPESEESSSVDEEES